MRMTMDVRPTGVTTATVIFTQAQVDQIRGEHGRARVPVVIAFEGSDFRTSIAVYRGEWMMVVNADMRAAGLTPGTAHEVDIRRDTQERTVEVPADLAEALDQAGVADDWAQLSYTRRREVVRSIDAAKRADTRARRVAAAVNQLRQ